MVRHYLNTEPAQDMEVLRMQYVEAVWLEERSVNVIASAFAKAFEGQK